MAEFCRQCSEEILGERCSDFYGITSTNEWKRGKAAIVLCEGCGVIQVDPEGRCVSEDCLRHGHKQKECA